MNAADFYCLPEGPPYPQLVAGEIVQDPSPFLDHQTIQGNLHLILSSHIASHRLGRVILAPFDVYLTDTDVFEPDLLFVSHARSAGLKPRGLFGAPDLAIEIVSPTSARRDRRYKLSVYREAGTADYWIVDPLTRTVECHDFSGGGLHRCSGYDQLRASCLPAFEARTAAAFVNI